MSVLDWVNYPTRDYTAVEAEPYVMDIVVCVERGNTLTHEDVLKAVGYGVAVFFDDARVAQGGWWHAQTLAWLEGRIRKVVRRARGKEWETVRTLESVYVNRYGVEVVILPPHPVNAPIKEVAKLQVEGLNLPHSEQYNTSSNGLNIIINPELGMTTGKAAAQFGHAVQIAIFENDYNTVLSWRHNSFPINFCNWDILDKYETTIHDAGYTEIPEGSLTAQASLRY